MIARHSKRTAAEAIIGLYSLALVTFVGAALYLLKDFLIPITLAILLTFLLWPLVARLERWTGRLLAVLAAVALIFAGAGAAGWVITRQMVDLAAQLPNYKANIDAKIQSLRVPATGVWGRFSQTMEELRQELAKIGDPSKSASAETNGHQALPVQIVQEPQPIPVQIVEACLSQLQDAATTAGLVVVLLIFMLLKREDLRNRFLRLVGQGHISTAARAIQDASRRISHYLLMQLLVNTAYGVAVAIGLHLIGLPNAFLWGALAGALRFIPYAGPLIGAALPILLSLAVARGWLPPLLTAGLFAALEGLINSFVEPWLYGSRTGVSAVALIMAAIFWTWLWGPVGLLLATPLTVCLVVLGRHIPRLQFLSILLSDEEALNAGEECYQRLLSGGLAEMDEDAHERSAGDSLASFYDTALLPALALAEADYQRGALDEEERTNVLQAVEDITSNGEGGLPAAATRNAAERAPEILCIPAHSERDRLACEMLAQLLKERGISTSILPPKTNLRETLAEIERQRPVWACISVTPPSTAIRALYWCGKLRKHAPHLRLVAGLWGASDHGEIGAHRLRAAGADYVAASLGDAVGAIAKNRMPADAGKEIRLAAA